jgi:fructose-bisphosphate aldolase class I
MTNLIKVARLLVSPGKGILAADESHPTIAKRFQSIGITSTEEVRRDYREMLFRTKSLGEYISGVILFDETLHQNTADGTPLKELLLSQGIIPGIKVDRGAKPLAGFPGEKITEGLDGLRDRFKDYASHGAQFSKWRAVLTISETTPTPFCLQANAHALARFAALSQEAGLVPIVETEVLMEGSHGIQRCEEATAAALKAVFDALSDHRVVLEGMLLKPNMVISGLEHTHQASSAEIAQATLRCFNRYVPAAVPGVVFLSGGQSDLIATRNLNALNQLKNTPGIRTTSMRLRKSCCIAHNATIKPGWESMNHRWRHPLEHVE